MSKEPQTTPISDRARAIARQLTSPTFAFNNPDYLRQAEDILFTALTTTAAEARAQALEDAAKVAEGQCHLATDHPSIAHCIRALKTASEVGK